MRQLALLFVEELMSANRAVVCHADEDCVARDVLRSAIDVRARMIDVPPVLDSNQVGNLGHKIRAAIESREGAGIGKAVNFADFLGSHRLESVVYVGLDP